MPDIVTTNGARAFGGVIALVAIIAGVYAMTRLEVEPMGQRIDFLSEQLLSIRKDMALDDARERTDRDAFARVSERFKEVETQFSNQSTRIEVFEEWQRWWHRNIPTTDARQDGRLDALERVTYGNLQRRDLKQGDE